MKKLLIQFFLFITFTCIVFCTGCNTTEEAKPQAPSIDVAIISNGGNYEAGDIIPYLVTASIPGGFKRGATIIVQPNGFSSTYPFPVTTVIRNDTTIQDTLYFLSAKGAFVGEPYKINVDVTDNEEQRAEASTSLVLATRGQGGGGAVPLLRGITTINLEAEGSTTSNNYLASATGTIYNSTDAKANQAMIDITFGVGNTGGPSLISPDQRTVVGLNIGNPVMDTPRTTFFKEEPTGPTNLGNVSAHDVATDISISTTKNVRISTDRTYSFVQSGSAGKKGYIRVTNISGAGTNQTVTFKYVVQQ